MKRYHAIGLIGALVLSLSATQVTQARPRHAAPMAMAGAATWEVTTGEGSDGATVNLFLPETLHIHVGDTVRWHVQGSIELHDIAFGSPSTIQNLATRLLGPVARKAGPPLLAFNPQEAAATPLTTYDGTGMVHSALMADGQTYSLTFTKAGTYHYYCLMHYPYMSGTVVVSPQPATPRYIIQAGYHDLGVDSAADQFYDANFGPTALTIRAGDTVTWMLNTAVPHTISLGPSAMLKQLLARQVLPVKGTGGQMMLALNPMIVAPSGGPTYDGAGFHNSGLLFPRPGQTVTYAVTFTKPGTYYYACLIHRGMDGYIHVLAAGSM